MAHCYLLLLLALMLPFPSQSQVEPLRIASFYPCDASELEVLQFHFLLDPNPDPESPNG